MSNTPRQLTRNQLAEFLPNARAVRAFEQLLQQVGTILPSDVATLNRLIEESSVSAGDAGAKAQSAIDLLVQMSSLLQLALLASREKHNSVATDYLDISTTAPAAGAVGRMKWNDTEGTLDLGLKGGNVTLQIGQENVLLVKNDDTVQLTDGMVVYVSGASGANVLVKRALADSDITSASTIGVVTEHIAVNGQGFVTTFGAVRGLNTNAFNEGDVLYLSPTVLGELTNVKPVAPQHLVTIGFCTKKSGGNGELFVSVNNGYEIDELHNVLITAPVLAGSLLIYDATVGVWKNSRITPGTNVTVTNADGAITISVAGAPPTGAAGGVLSGTYPNPGFAVDMATQAELDAHAGATGTAVHGLGTASALTADTDGTLAANSDTRIATQKAVKTYVSNAVAGLLDFKGNIDCSTNPNYPAALKGDAYAVSVAGKIGGASGVSVDIGDMIVASADNAGGTQVAVGTSWFVLEHNLVGALLSANNLSDLANAATARSNLGLGNVENKTFATGVADATHAATSKTTPVDADELPLSDSAASFALKKLTWANVKATLKTYFDTLYQAASANLTAWAGKTAPSGTVVGTTDTQIISSKNITTSNIDSTTVGATTASTGKFTSLAYSDAVATAGLNIKESGTFNDNLSHAFSSWGAAWGIAYITSGNGVTVIPWFSNGGGGVGFSHNILDPDAGTWVYGNTVTFTSVGSTNNTYSFTVSNGAGQPIIQRTAGTNSYSVYIAIMGR